MALVEQFAALGDAVRLRMVEMLSEEPLPVHRLAAAFAISRPAISRHLRVLKDAGFVKEEKRGRENVYTVRRARLKPIAEWTEMHRHRQAASADRRPKTRAEPGGASLTPSVPESAPQMGFDF